MEAFVTENSYDSTKATQEHIDMVNKYLRFMAHQLLVRGIEHDRSKLHTPEKEMFDKVTPKLKDTVYNSSEYKEHLVELGDALSHHYSHNRHHTEHWPNGIMDMNLVDIMEMFCDWCAATLRHNSGNIHTSIAINKDKYGIGEVLAQIFENTVNEYNMGKVDNA
jgi:hypothetical protein